MVKWFCQKQIPEEEDICSSETIIPERKLFGYEKANNNFSSKFSRGEKFLTGCHAIAGKSVEAIVAETGMSRSYVYAQRTEVLKHAEDLDISEPKSPVLVLDNNTIEKIVLILTMECQSPSSGIQSFFGTICGINVSAGRISNILNEAAKRAQDFDDTVDLSGVSQMAVDEIFQCGRPILTGVDPVSTYTFLLEEASDRTADTWALYLDDRKDKGLDPETSINDGGLGLMAGIPQVFPEAEIQADTFHALHNMGKEVSKLERKHLSLRTWCARLVRKGIRFSKTAHMHKIAG